LDYHSTDYNKKMKAMLASPSSFCYTGTMKKNLTEPLLDVTNLSKYFGSLLALDGVTFTLYPGEVLGLVGQRSSGKSTLLHLLYGMHPPTGGEIIFEGKNISLLSPSSARQKRIELVNQPPLLTENLDITHNIFLGKEICWPPKIGVPDLDKMHLRACELMADFDLPVSLLSARTVNLSDEQRQLVSISRALCQPAKLLLLDDPFATLSFHRQQILLERIQQMATEGMAIIISSDNLTHLFTVTDRILVLYQGRLVAERVTAKCTPRDIVELIVGTSNREQVTPIIWALENYHTAQRQSEELHSVQAKLRRSLEAQDSLNQQLIERLHDQVEALDRLNAALQATQLRLMTEREQERKALARELHDQAIQDLLSYIYQLEEAENNETVPEQQTELAEIRNGIRQVIGDLRQLCSDLRPPTIDSHGLSAAIHSYAQDWAERNGILLSLDIDPSFGRLPEAIELSVFRIVQEGLNNVRKHASARHVFLTVQRTQTTSVLFRCKDDGKGLAKLPDLSNLSAQKHFGLLSISERVALLGGSMEINSPPEGGVVLEVEIPNPYPSVQGL
jgi:signal transduction histidine kinase